MVNGTVEDWTCIDVDRHVREKDQDKVGGEMDYSHSGRGTRPMEVFLLGDSVFVEFDVHKYCGCIACGQSCKMATNNCSKCDNSID